ncbi:MAG: acetyl-CoA hydrolase/transferase C-terminal domain-containing protein [Anaerolineales bacterium]
MNEGRADYVPVFLSEAAGLFRNGEPPLDIAVDPGITAGRTRVLLLWRGSGRHQAGGGSGANGDCRDQPANAARAGGFVHHLNHIHRLVEVDYPLPEIKIPMVMPIHERIGEIVAEMIPNGATLQFGIGGLPNAVLSKLGNKRDLGIHSELFSDGVMELAEAGVIANDAKNLHPGKAIAGFLFGSKRLYDFVDDNAMIELHPADYVNDPFIIDQNNNMISINSAIEVDLSGQVCADSCRASICLLRSSRSDSRCSMMLKKKIEKTMAPRPPREWRKHSLPESVPRGRT